MSYSANFGRERKIQILGHRFKSFSHATYTEITKPIRKYTQPINNHANHQKIMQPHGIQIRIEVLDEGAWDQFESFFWDLEDPSLMTEDMSSKWGELRTRVCSIQRIMNQKFNLLDFKEESLLNWNRLFYFHFKRIKCQEQSNLKNNTYNISWVIWS